MKALTPSASEMMTDTLGEYTWPLAAEKPW